MRRSLSAVHDRHPLKAPFRIARGVKTAADVVTVTLCESDATGRGEGVLYPRYGETVETALAEIDQVRAAVEAGAGRDELLSLMRAGAARSALDAALWDLDVRTGRATLPDAVPMETAVTVGIDTPDAMHRAALTPGGVTLVKVKVDAMDVAARIAAVRAALPHARMIVDANESWTIDLLRQLRPALIAARVDLIEQPLPAGSDTALAGIALPLAADESVHGVADLDRLAGLYSHINVKLDKAGGLTAAMTLVEAARARGFRLMLGCMVGSSLAIAPAMRLAAAAEFVDLDGPWWLARDLPGGVTIEKGRIVPPEPGFWADANPPRSPPRSPS